MTLGQYIKENRPDSLIYNVRYKMIGKPPLPFTSPIQGYTPYNGFCYRTKDNLIHYVFILGVKFYLYTSNIKEGKIRYDLISETRTPLPLLEELIIMTSSYR